MKWTDKQLDVINTRGRNILVSAAAGSGKTAVLVERIIQMITDKENPVNIDELLVVTFTRAAASEMKERVRDSLEELSTLNPEDENLQKQLSYIHNAKITTIDSFCSSVVKEHFDQIDLDPNYRIGDEIEFEMMKADIIEEMLEEYYERGEEDFMSVAEQYTTGKMADNIGELISTIYGYAMMHYNPKRWIENCIQIYDIDSPEELMETKLMKEYVRHLEIIGEDTSKLPIDEMTDEIINCRDSARTIINLTLDFMERYEKTKKEKGLADFNDQALMALHILNDEDEDGNLMPSDVAKKMSKQYKEIMIDEYQDSNYIQEAILFSISGGFGVGNMFMVGDVKQSIYRFRKAEPKLFLHKFDTFSSDLSHENVKIILDKNFRSRREIIDSVNFLFDQIMNRDFGGIDYKNENRLVTGAKYDEAPDGQDNRTEFILLDSSDIENEAEFVAQKIKEITDPKNGMKITAEGEKYRPVKYGDIAILLRTVSGISDIYQEHLSNYGIASYAENRTGYYEAMEVQNVLNFLSIIDNPRQDIPLVATMTSPMFYFTAEELAVIKSECLKENFYDCVVSYEKDVEQGELAEKVRQFLTVLNEFRLMVPYTSVYDLIHQILKRTGYDLYIKSMVNGKKRYLNIEMLKEKAVSYDEISYKGLFNFVRYIERIKKMNRDEGEMSLAGEYDNTVRIMSIHKSKGLQFPVVFLCESDKVTRRRSQQITTDEEGNIGIDCIDEKLGTKTETIYKKSMKVTNFDETIAEELRVLYVALTRAKEKLFITAGNNKIDQHITAFAEKKYDLREQVSYRELMERCSYMEWIGKALGKNKAFDDVSGEHEVNEELTNSRYNEESGFKVSLVTKEMIEIHAIQINLNDHRREEALEVFGGVSLTEQEMQAFDTMVNYAYPYEKYISMFSKASVTELKKRSMAYEEELDGHALYSQTPKSEREEAIPDFAKTDKKLQKTGAGRGSAYHRVLELLDMTLETYTEDNVSEMIERFTEEGLIDIEDADCIDPKDIVAFTKTNLFMRMKEAYKRGELYRERKFLMGVPIAETDDTMIVQGIIDVCFMEDGKYVLADYKTDRVSEMSELVKRYHVQLESYKQALEQISGIQVSEMIIYSVTLNDEIRVEE